MKISYDVEVPKTSYKNREAKSPLSIAISEFVDSDRRNMSIEYEDAKSAASGRACAQVYIKRNNVQAVSVLRKNTLYIIKKA